MGEADYSSDQLVVPRLTSGRAVLWVVGTAVAVLAVAGFLFAQQPGDRWAVLVVVLVLALFATWLLVRSVRVDRSAGRVVSRSLLGTRSVAWAEADRLDLVNNRGGSSLLVVGEPRSRSLALPILALTDYVKRSQSSQTLRALADEIERWAPDRAAVAGQLRRQAEHLEHGGSAEGSPLAALVTHGVTTAAKAGGAAGSSSLLD